jgi:hypothetical protein
MPQPSVPWFGPSPRGVFYGRNPTQEEPLESAGQASAALLPCPGPAEGTGCRLLRNAPGHPAPEETDETEIRAEERTRGGGFLLCAACGHRITHNGEKIRVQGAHEHTFANPHGYFFRIGCFRTAAGCRHGTGETTDFSWFSGFAWRIETCANCSLHLGWAFRSGTDGFHGLILDRLVEEEPSSHE